MYLVIPALVSILTFGKAQLAMGGLPIGYDVSTAYLSSLYYQAPTFMEGLKGFNLLYWVWGLIQQTGIDPILLLKISGVVIPTLLVLGFAALLRQLFPRHPRLVALTSTLLIFQIPFLRFSWDLYRNSFSLALALFGVTLLLGAKRHVFNIVAGLACCLVAIFSHQIVAMALAIFAILSLTAYIVKTLALKWQWLILVAIIPIVFVLISPYVQVNEITLRAAETAPPRLARELLWFLFASLAPFVGLGMWHKRHPLLASFTVVLLAISLSPFFSRSHPFYLWDRWMYFLIVPFSIYAAIGLKATYELLKKTWPKAGLVPVGIIAILMSLPGLHFLRSDTPTPRPFPLSNENLFGHTPSQFLWNSIGFEQLADLKKAADLIVADEDGLTVIYASPQYLGLIRYFIPENLQHMVVIADQSTTAPYTAPRNRYYIYGVNYGQFAPGTLLPGSPVMQPAQLYDASRL